MPRKIDEIQVGRSKSTGVILVRIGRQTVWVNINDKIYHRWGFQPIDAKSDYYEMFKEIP